VVAIQLCLSVMLKWDGLSQQPVELFMNSLENRFIVLHIYTYIYIYVCVYRYACICIYMCIYIYTYIHTHVYICVYIYIYIELQDMRRRWLELV